MSELLVAQRRWGVTRCRKFLERNHISEIKQIGALTDRQRRMLAAQLQSRSPLVFGEATVVPESATPALELQLAYA
ncbi:MAG TPA: hypothetical protein VG405_03290 [Solirubrobacteraceae bacterium]|nr:hypothetical protein [Solirubrobacteraceae bacterium]